MGAGATAMGPAAAPAQGARAVRVTVVGAGLAGLSAAIGLAEAGVPCRLVSSQPSERAQSVLAEGGINAALDTMGEGDSTQAHYEDTMRAGCDIADPVAVRNLAEGAPAVVAWLDGLGVPFQRSGRVIQQRPFGGQRKRRTAYAQSSIGKALMTALIDEARRWEAAGLVERLVHHDLVRLALAPDGSLCLGAWVRDQLDGGAIWLPGPVVMATGGLAGLFPGKTTGTTADTGDAAAALFSQGVPLSNLEMIQYHPTTLAIPGKRLLVSEAARGEGGRLYVERGGERWHFMEERYPELGNLMPRDVVSREEYLVTHDEACGDQVYLDCTGLPRATWERRLPDLRRQVLYYTGSDPAREPVAVEPGIHYFMGGVHVDDRHRSPVRGLYAAGECCSLYHGANRLGGNSTLGAVFGGRRAAATAASELGTLGALAGEAWSAAAPRPEAPAREDVSRDRDQELADVLFGALGVVRCAPEMRSAQERVREMLAAPRSGRERERLLLGLALLSSALARTESRGAHWRSDFPARDDALRGTMVATLADAAQGRVDVRLEPRRQEGGGSRA